MEELCCGGGSRYRVEFTEQGASAAPRLQRQYFQDTISRLQAMAEEANEAVPAHTQVRVSETLRWLRLPKKECCQVWTRLPPSRRPNNWDTIEEPVVPLERNLYGHLLAGQLWEREFVKVLLGHGWEKFQIGNAFIVNREKGLLLSVYVDDFKLAGKKQNIDRMWNVHMKELDLGEPTSFLDHVFLGWTQRECETSKDIVDNYRNMFESKISAGATEKLPCSENLSISSWSCDPEGHAKKCVERYCELANKNTPATVQSYNPML